MREGDLWRIDIFGKVEGHSIAPPQVFILINALFISVIGRLVSNSFNVLEKIRVLRQQQKTIENNRNSCREVLVVMRLLEQFLFIFHDKISQAQNHLQRTKIKKYAQKTSKRKKVTYSLICVFILLVLLVKTVSRN